MPRVRRRPVVGRRGSTAAVPAVGGRVKLHEHPAVESFDQWADAQLERLRGNPVADRVFTAASELGDFSLIWHLIGAAQGLRSDEDADATARLAVVLLAESLLVNQGVKRLFRRQRPLHEAIRPHALRRPSTSSFPGKTRARTSLAVRATLGAGRLRIAAHFLGESLCLSAIAGALALLVIHIAVRALVAFGPNNLPRLSELNVGLTTVGFVLSLIHISEPTRPY